MNVTYVNIVFSNGLEVTHRNLSNECLCGMIDIVKDRFPNPYNGDVFAFMSKNRQLLKLVRYENCMYMLYGMQTAI